MTRPAPSLSLPLLVLIAACSADGRVTSNPWNTLSATVRWRTSNEATSYVRFGHDGQTWQTGSDELTKKHNVVVFGLRPDTDYTFELVSETKSGRESTSTLEWTSGAPPALAEQFEVSVDERELVQPGWTLFNLQEPNERSLAVAYDLEGYPVWYHELAEVDEGVIDANITPRGAVMIGGTPPPGENAFEITWQGEELWRGPRQVREGKTGYLHHHTERLPGGNVLMLEKLREGALGDRAFELTPDGERAWEWSPFDHFEAPAQGDWTHTNWIHKDDEGFVWLSMAALSQIVKFDSRTGDVQWVLGRGGDFDLVNDSRWFDFQHAPYVLPNGDLMVYDNRGAGGRTRVVVYELDEENWTAEVVWKYDGGDENPWLAKYMGSSYPLPNGNVLVCAGGDLADRRLFEVTHDGDLVWQMHTGKVYRARRVDIPLEPVLDQTETTD